MTPKLTFKYLSVLLTLFTLLACNESSQYRSSTKLLGDSILLFDKQSLGVWISYNQERNEWKNLFTDIRFDSDGNIAYSAEVLNGKIGGWFNESEPYNTLYVGTGIKAVRSIESLLSYKLQPSHIFTVGAACIQLPKYNKTQEDLVSKSKALLQKSNLKTMSKAAKVKLIKSLEEEWLSLYEQITPCVLENLEPYPLANKTSGSFLQGSQDGKMLQYADNSSYSLFQFDLPSLNSNTLTIHKHETSSGLMTENFIFQIEESHKTDNRYGYEFYSKTRFGQWYGYLPEKASNEVLWQPKSDMTKQQLNKLATNVFAEVGFKRVKMTVQELTAKQVAAIKDSEKVFEQRFSH